MPKERTFHTTKRDGSAVEVTTKLSNAQAIKALGGYDGDTFEAKCAFEIHKLNAGFRCNEKLVTWGFVIAERKANPPKQREGVTFDVAKLRKVIRSRRPGRFEIEGRRYEVGFCGEASKHSGKFRVTNGEKYGSPHNEFYGYIDTDGVWTPTRKVCDVVLADVTGALNALIG